MKAYRQHIREFVLAQDLQSRYREWRQLGSGTHMPASTNNIFNTLDVPQKPTFSFPFSACGFFIFEKVSYDRFTPVFLINLWIRSKITTTSTFRHRTLVMPREPLPRMIQMQHMLTFQTKRWEPHRQRIAQCHYTI